MIMSRVVCGRRACHRFMHGRRLCLARSSAPLSDDACSTGARARADEQMVQSRYREVASQRDGERKSHDKALDRLTSASEAQLGANRSAITQILRSELDLVRTQRDTAIY